MRDRDDGIPTVARWTSSKIDIRKLITKTKNAQVNDAVADEGLANTDDKETPSKLAMMKQIETPAKVAINIDGTSHSIVKAASAKETPLSTHHAVSTRQSGDGHHNPEWTALHTKKVTSITFFVVR